MKPKNHSKRKIGSESFTNFCERNVIDLFSLYPMAYVIYISYQLQRRKNTKPV